MLDLATREYYFCDFVCDVQTVIGADSGVAMDTGVENRDTQ